MQLTAEQKLQALAHRFYQEVEWSPKKGDLYTTTRADLEVYEVVYADENIVRTRYTEGCSGSTEWPVDGFLTDGFGPKRVWIPPFILAS